MIMDLNATVKGEKPRVNDFTPIPDGEYKAIVKEIKPWEGITKDIYVNEKDENGWLVKDADGKKVTTLHKDFTFYNAKVTFEILDGDYKGRKLIENLTTHPNASFITSNFLYAANIGEITVGEIPNKCVGVKMIVGIETDTYTKKTKIKDKETGEETYKEEEKSVNRIKSFAKLELDDETLGL